MVPFHSIYHALEIAGRSANWISTSTSDSKKHVVLAAVSVIPADAMPATRTVTGFEAQTPPNTLTEDLPTPLSTPTLVYSISVVGTTTTNGNTMTVYGEDIINSEYIQVDGYPVTNVEGSTSYTWSTEALSTTFTEHEVFEVGTTAIDFILNNGSAAALEPAINIECNFDSGASSETGVCTEVVQFPGQSTAQTTAWTGSIIPIFTFEVSVSATTTGSVTNAAGSMKGGQWSGLLATTCVVAVFFSLAGLIYGNV
ncbi:hypothetical protein EV368DRAFT_88154 [Lentinula lateritia]|nr:hypothetical protein EV368DRAFT_88154 [Lentinula lateritia]